jgi:hypothetical protein
MQHVASSETLRGSRKNLASPHVTSMPLPNRTEGPSLSIVRGMQPRLFTANEAAFESAGSSDLKARPSIGEHDHDQYGQDHQPDTQEVPEHLLAPDLAFIWI